jgi:uncharacterized membrane protein
MTQSTTVEPSGAVSKKGLALIVYVLYLVGFAVGLTAIAGVVMAHVSRDQAEDWVKTHFSFQIRTFWYGFGMLVLGVILAFVLIGYLVLLFWFVWTLVRCIKGILALNDNRPIANPASLLFG